MHKIFPLNIFTDAYKDVDLEKPLQALRELLIYWLNLHPTDTHDVWDDYEDNQLTGPLDLEFEFGDFSGYIRLNIAFDAYYFEGQHFSVDELSVDTFSLMYSADDGSVYQIVPEIYFKIRYELNNICADFKRRHS